MHLSSGAAVRNVCCCTSTTPVCLNGLHRVYFTCIFCLSGTGYSSYKFYILGLCITILLHLTDSCFCVSSEELEANFFSLGAIAP
jgi:hypothetical protein